MFRWTRSLFDKLSFLLLIAVAGLGTAPTNARAPDTVGMLKVQLQARYSEMKVAMAAKDANAIRAIVAPDFTSTDASGRVEAISELLAGIASLQPDPNKVSKTTIKSIIAQGGTAIVKQAYEMRTMRSAPDGTSYPFSMLARSTDIWTKFDNRWRLSRTMTEEMSIFKNGELTAHQVRANR
jgi:ketosteroid isomerase-like protein